MQLVCHADTPTDRVSAIAVSVARAAPCTLRLRYDVACVVEALVLGEPRLAERADDLWTTTCFEAFVAADAEDGYVEYNLAPSRQWAAHRFASYRSGKADFAVAREPNILFEVNDGDVSVAAEIELPAFWSTALLECNFTAVIEETCGRKSYWALRHPPGKPDFHDRDCFAFQLEAPRGP